MKHILIVDDEPKISYLLARVLQLSEQDFEVSTARSGEGALEVLEKDHVDLLVTDLEMPGVSGLELIRWVKAMSADTRTILVTSSDDEKIRAEANRLGVFHCLTKPFNVKDFTRIVDDALQDQIANAAGIAIISESAFDALIERLNRLRDETSAQWVSVADVQGQLLADVGSVDGIDNTMLLALLSGGSVTNAEVARRFNSGSAVTLVFQEGQDYDIYSAGVGDRMILSLVFERRTQKSLMGMVWLYTRRAVDDVLALLSSPEVEEPDQVLEAGFTSSIMAELDTAFDADSHVPAQSGRPDTVERAESRPSPPRHAGHDIDDGRLLSMDEAIKRGLLPPTFHTSDGPG